MLKLIVAVLSLSSSLAFADARDICTQNDSKPLLDAIHFNMLNAVSGIVKQYFVELYASAGITITGDNVRISPITDGLFGPSFEVRVDDGARTLVFGSRIDSSAGVSNLQATDNAKWDNLGNLISPATEVICTGEQHLGNAIGFYNKATGHSVGSLKLPQEMRCPATGCDVSGSVVLRI